MWPLQEWFTCLIRCLCNKSSAHFEIVKAGVHTFSKNTGAVSELWVPERQHAARCTHIGYCHRKFTPWDFFTSVVKSPIFCCQYILLSFPICVFVECYLLTASCNGFVPLVIDEWNNVVHCWNDTDRKTEVFREKPVPVHVYSWTCLCIERTAIDHLCCSVHNSVLMNMLFLLHILMPFSYIGCCFTVQNCTLEYRIFLNLICTSFCQFLKWKKS
jgi:hypothetical protein